MNEPITAVKNAYEIELEQKIEALINWVADKRGCSNLVAACITAGEMKRAHNAMSFRVSAAA